MDVVLPTATGSSAQAPGRFDARRWRDRLPVFAACAAAIAFICAQTTDDAARFGTDQSNDAIAAERARLAEKVRYRGGETFVGAYGGMPYTYASDVRLTRPGTDMTVHGVDWEGRPFDNPIYYGARVARWLPMSNLGGMIDFTHSKAYSPLDQTVRISGTKDGTALAPEAKLGERFHKLEFTHGHNMLTLNGLVRLPFGSAFVSPYVGLGAGVSLPHTEVQLKGEGFRTYEYQYTGPALQFVFGLELRVPRLSYFVEYKFSFADYLAPLHKRDGGWIGFDLWHQAQRWWRGGTPEGGWVATVLASHQVIAGMGYRSAPMPIVSP
jgi:hypothetical protein